MIYLDNNATTQIADEVFEAMLPYLKDHYGNASSIQHKLGRDANHAIQLARQQVCEALHIDPKEIFFTSGATEAINMAIKGVAERYQAKGKHIITCQTEHKAVLSTCENLEKKGYQVTYLPVNEYGVLDLELLEESITDQTILVALMLANNETGCLHPIDKIAEICVKNEVLLFCDATQYIGKSPLDLREIPIDMLCLSAHKFHGPKGIGALYIRRKSKPIQLEALIEGGMQENKLRAGTYNVPAIVGLGKAISLALNEYNDVAHLRNYFEEKILKEIEEVSIISQNTERLANTSNIHIKHVRSNELMMKLNHIAIASGSACVTGSRDPSHVLKAMGLRDDEAFCCLRISLSRYTTKKEIDETIIDLKNVIRKIRNESPIWQMYKNGLID